MEAIDVQQELVVVGVVGTGSRAQLQDWGFSENHFACSAAEYDLQRQCLAFVALAG